MKKIVITLLSVAAATTMYGQGNFNFNNLSSVGTITVSSNHASGEGLTGQFVGSGYTASLYWGAAGATTFSQLASLPISGGDPVFFGNGTADPDQSGFAGFFDGGNIIVNGAPGGSTIQVAVAVWWSGGGAQGVATSYAQALSRGYNTGTSALVPIVVTTSADPSTIQDLTALPSFTVGATPVITPEPATLALCGLGAASLLLFRRKK